MPGTQVKLTFFKLNVADMDRMLAFYREVFGFEIVQTFDVDDFLEHMLALPGQENGPQLMLVRFKDDRDVRVGPGHGPVGLQTGNIADLHERALAAGATKVTGVFGLDHVEIAIVLDPEGHELELLQFRQA